MTVSALMVSGAPSLRTDSKGSTPSLSPRRVLRPSQSAPATNLAGSADPSTEPLGDSPRGSFLFHRVKNPERRSYANI